MAPQAAGFCRSGRIDLLFAQKYELLQSNSRLLGCERVMETRAEYHFSWVYTFSAKLSSAPCGTEQTTIDTGCDQHSRATVLIIQQTATSSKLQPY